MAIIKIKNIDELELSNRPIYYGSNSYIFKFRGKYFKLFHPILTNLDDKNNNNRFKILEELMDKKYFKYVILPDDIFVTDNNFWGYSMPICLGKPLNAFEDSLSYYQLIEALKKLLIDVKKLSEFGLFDPDIWSGNVLFDGQNLYLIDLDNSCHYDDMMMAYKLMGFSLFKIILDKLFSIEKLDLVEDKDINLVRRNIENLNTTDYIACLNLIKFKLERIDNKTLEDVGDLRRALMISLNRSNS